MIIIILIITHITYTLYLQHIDKSINKKIDRKQKQIYIYIYIFAFVGIVWWPITVSLIDDAMNTSSTLHERLSRLESQAQHQSNDSGMIVVPKYHCFISIHWSLGISRFYIWFYHVYIHIFTYMHTYIPTYLPTYVRTYIHTYNYIDIYYT